MAIYGKFMDEIYDCIKNSLVRKKENTQKIKQFSLIWDTVRDEYERRYGRDTLYNALWIEDDFVHKEILAEIRKYPASREFVKKLYLYTEKRFGGNSCSIIDYKNFVDLFCTNLIDSQEFSEKMIKVRRDLEFGRVISGINCCIEQSSEIVKDNIDYFEIESEQLQDVGSIDNSSIIELYADNYTKVMFMQRKNEAQVKLEDIYVENEYEFVVGSGRTGNLLKLIEEFCKKNIFSVLFIEGHAGIGKSSLISKIAHKYRNEGVLWGRALVIIQMRNLSNNESKLDVYNPWADIKNYLHFKGSMKDFMYLMDNTILILDGFDELCLVDDIRLSNKLLYVSNMKMKMEDYACGCKIIMTTRPNYLARKNEWHKIFTVMPIVIRLSHFSVEKRIEWVNLAKKANMKIKNQVVKSITSDIKDDIDVVASTPLTLYLIAHEGIVISKNDELWSVYQNIFGKEIMRKRYDHLNIDGELSTHPGEWLSSIIYEITKEISYYMFQKGKMDILWEEIESKIENISIQESVKNSKLVVKNGEIKDLLKDSYALFNYYKETNLGGIAFYHNYIREFFLQEKVSGELNQIYAKELKNKITSNNSSFSVNFSNELFELLRYGRLSDKTIDFMISYGRVFKSDDSLWVNLEKQFHFIRDIFTDILIHDTLEEYKENFILNIWLLLGVVYEINNDKYRDVYDRTRLKEINHKNCLAECLEIISRSVTIENVDFSGINWRGKVVKNVVFNECKFNKTEMGGGIIKNIDFLECEMQNILLSGAELSNVTFDNTNLMNAFLNGTTINHGIFSCCKMNSCKLNGAKMKNTHFIRANIETAYLYGTDFGNASFNDEEQIMNNISHFKYALIDKIIWRENGELILRKMFDD